MELVLLFLGLWLTGSIAIERLLEMVKPALLQSAFFADSKKLLENALVLIGVLCGVAFAWQTHFTLFAGLPIAESLSENTQYIISGILIGAGANYTHDIKRLMDYIKQVQLNE